jgi:putative NADH-flavin reductase
MKLIIFGATGGTGRQILKQALEAGHEVTAFVRNPHALATKRSKLKVMQGDAMDNRRVSQGIDGQDAVLFAIGINRRSTMTVCADSTRHIIEGMKDGVRRFICLSAYGASETKDSALYTKALRFFYRQTV